MRDSSQSVSQSVSQPVASGIEAVIKDQVIEVKEVLGHYRTCTYSVYAQLPAKFPPKAPTRYLP